VDNPDVDDIVETESYPSRLSVQEEHVGSADEVSSPEESILFAGEPSQV
jgi:hypothetical protein